MNKLLIAFGLVILFVTLPCASQDEENSDLDEEASDDFDADDMDGGDDNGGEESGDHATTGKFVESDGVKKTCSSHPDCYDQREPPSWCRLKEDQTWADKGCHCDPKENACIIERKTGGQLEYTYCASESNWKCL